MKSAVIACTLVLLVCTAIAQPARAGALDVIFDVVDVDYVDMSTGERVGYGLLGVALAVVGTTIGVVAIVASAPVWLTTGAILTGGALVGAGVHYGLKGFYGREMVVDDQQGSNVMRYRNDPLYIPEGKMDPFIMNADYSPPPEPQLGLSRI